MSSNTTGVRFIITPQPPPQPPTTVSSILGLESVQEDNLVWVTATDNRLAKSFEYDNLGYETENSKSHIGMAGLTE